MKAVARIGLVVALLAAGCAAPPPASPAQPSRDPSDALYAENRGGPDLVLVVGSAPEVPLPCGASLGLRPGEAGLPDLPWSLVARRADSGEVVLTEQVAALPRWFVQLGTDAPGLSSNAVLGPAVTCPPPS
jgi:hypothetical protein